MSNYSIYILAVSVALYFCFLIMIPFGLKKHGTEHLKDRPKSFWVREVLIYITALALIILCYFIRYNLVSNICLNGCGVLGSYLATQELLPGKEDSNE